MLDGIGPWSQRKLDILRKYLHAYTTALKLQPFETYYVDAFAGVGRHQLRQSEEQEYVEFVDGSPLVALSTDPPFDHYWFVEVSPRRAEELKDRILATGSTRPVTVRTGDANVVVREQVLPLLRPRPSPPYPKALCFLDPFGMQVEWLTVADLAGTRCTEVIINLSLMGINRYGAPLRHEELTQEKVELVARIFGSHKWPEAVYQPSLLAEYRLKRTDAAESAARYYVDERLSSVFPYTAGPIIMRNSKNSPLYAIVWAGPNPLGQKIAMDVLSAYDD